MAMIGVSFTRIWFYIATLFCVWHSCSAVKKTNKYSSGDQFGVFLMKDFGLAVGGAINIDYDVAPKDTNLSYESYMLLLVISEDQRTGWYGALSGSNSNIIENMDELCTQPSMLRRVIDGQGSISLPISYSLGNDLYSVVLLQCRKGNAANPVVAEVTLEMKNPRPHSNKYSQYPIESVMEVRILEGESIIYGLLLLGLVGQLYIGWNFVRRIHFLFLATLVSVFVFTLVKYAEGYQYNKDGVYSISFNIAGNVFGVLATACLLCSLVLLSVGWSVIRVQMTANEVQMIVFALGTYVVFGMASAGCVDGSSTCVGFELVAFIFRALILLAVIIAMNFTVAQLRAMIAQSPWVPSTPIQYARAKQYTSFRNMFILYLLLPTALLIIQVVLFTWKEAWVDFLLAEVLDILLIFHVGVTFSPLHEPLMLRAFDGTATAAAAGAALHGQGEELDQHGPGLNFHHE